jgi:hypothetical protein
LKTKDNTMKFRLDLNDAIGPISEYTEVSKEQHAKHKEWRAANKDKVNEQEARARAKKPHIYRGKQATYYALKTGKITKPETCQKCGERVGKANLEGHHDNGYDGKNIKNIKWWCRSCHQRTKIRGDHNGAQEDVEQTQDPISEAGRKGARQPRSVAGMQYTPRARKFITKHRYGLAEKFEPIYIDEHWNRIVDPEQYGRRKMTLRPADLGIDITHAEQPVYDPAKSKFFAFSRPNLIKTQKVGDKDTVKIEVQEAARIMEPHKYWSQIAAVSPKGSREQAGVPTIKFGVNAVNFQAAAAKAESPVEEPAYVPPLLPLPKDAPEEVAQQKSRYRVPPQNVIRAVSNALERLKDRPGVNPATLEVANAIIQARPLGDNMLKRMGANLAKASLGRNKPGWQPKTTDRSGETVDDTSYPSADRANWELNGGEAGHKWLSDVSFRGTFKLSWVKDDELRDWLKPEAGGEAPEGTPSIQDLIKDLKHEELIKFTSSKELGKFVAPLSGEVFELPKEVLQAAMGGTLGPEVQEYFKAATGRRVGRSATATSLPQQVWQASIGHWVKNLPREIRPPAEGQSKPRNFILVSDSEGNPMVGTKDGSAYGFRLGAGDLPLTYEIIRNAGIEGEARTPNGAPIYFAVFPSDTGTYVDKVGITAALAKYLKQPFSIPPLPFKTVGKLLTVSNSQGGKVKVKYHDVIRGIDRETVLPDDHRVMLVSKLGRLKGNQPGQDAPAPAPKTESLERAMQKKPKFIEPTKIIADLLDLADPTSELAEQYSVQQVQSDNEESAIKQIADFMDDI